MHFALLGDHADGIAMVRALLASGRHVLKTYTGSSAGGEALKRLGISCKAIRDLEEVLADPDIEAVIVATEGIEGQVQLRRALQSERHVLCIHPLDHSTDIVYEMAMIQEDTHRVLLPLLPGSLHPGVRRLAELALDEKGPLGTVQLVETEQSSREAIFLDPGTARRKFSLPGWDILRALGGEIAEVSAFGPDIFLNPAEPLLLTGRFERGGLFHTLFLPDQHEEQGRITLIGNFARAHLIFDNAWLGAARLTWPDEEGTICEESWDSWNPWQALVEVFEDAVAHVAPTPVTWQTAVRCMELDVAARSSLERRRVSSLDYPDVSEEVGFKGTMTLLGCGLLWGILLFLILSIWIPWLGWLIIPLLVFFLGMQLLRWMVPGAQPRLPGDRDPKNAE
jgi:predicted dehydrogenase